MGTNCLCLEAGLSILPTRVAFHLPGVGMVDTPAEQDWPLTRVVCLLFVVLCCVSVRQGQSLRSVVQGSAGLSCIAAALALPCMFLWQQLDTAEGTFGHARPVMLALAVLAILALVELQRRLQARIGWQAAALGTLLPLVLLLQIANRVTPGSVHLLAWPILALVLALGALVAPREQALSQGARGLIVLAGLAPGVLLLIPLLRPLFSRAPPEHLGHLGHLSAPMLALALLLMLGMALLTVLLTALLSVLRSRLLVPGLVLALALVAILMLASPGSALLPGKRATSAFATGLH